MDESPPAERPRPTTSDGTGRLGALRESDAVEHASGAHEEHASNQHLALLYDDPDEQLATVAPFVRQGLRRGEQCVYVVDDNTPADVRAALADEGVDVPAARSAGALTILGREDYVTDGRFTPDDQLADLEAVIESATDDAPGVRVAVEMTCFLAEGPSYDELVAYEERYNALSEDVEAMALCQYNRDRFPPAVVRDVLRAHPHVVADGTLSRNVYYTPPEQYFGPDRPARNVDRMLETLQDRTLSEERLAAQERSLREQRDELARANERLEAFAGTVAHELRTPLGVASGYARQVARESDDDRLAKVVNAHERMEDLLVELLELARVGGEPSDVEWVDLAATAEDCWSTVRTAEATLATPTTTTVRCDRSQLRQLLSNLVENAVEHGGEDVTVTVGEIPGGFYVADDGPGVPVGERDRVFGRGYTTEDGGTGFGLGIVRDVTDAHGWALELTAGDDGGARFEVTGVERRDG